MIHVIMEG